MPELNPEQFGMTSREMSEMRGRAMGEHLFEGLEKIMFGEVGGMRAAAQAAALHRMRGIPAHMMSEDEHGHHAKYTAGGWTTTWHGGKYAEHSHPKHGAVDVSDVAIHHPNGDETLPELNGADIKRIHHDFLAYKKENYPDYMQ